MISDEERNRIILRRTLCAVAWLCALWTAALAAPLTGFGPDDLRRRGWFMLGHAALLAASGVGLWKPRLWGWPVAFAATLASLGYVTFDLLGRNWQAAWVDALFPLTAIVVFLRTRGFLDRGSGQG